MLDMIVSEGPPRTPPVAADRRRPERPQFDRDEIAGQIQDRLGRPLSWLEYCRIWNQVTELNGQSDFLTGERVFASEADRLMTEEREARG